jgi:hypothetical protein
MVMISFCCSFAVVMMTHYNDYPDSRTGIHIHPSGTEAEGGRLCSAKGVLFVFGVEHVSTVMSFAVIN